LQRGIGDDDADAFDIHFGVAERLEKAHARLRHHAQQQRIVEMAAVIHVARVKRNVGREREMLGKRNVNAGHGIGLTGWGGMRRRLQGALGIADVGNGKNNRGKP